MSEMVWSLPTTLKGKLSNTWAGCLENLANSNSLPLSTYSFLQGRIANEHASARFDTPCQSWESVLSILAEEEAVDQDGELKLLPIFVTMPPVMQLRFIFFLQSHISQITGSAINTFLQRIETSQKNMWIVEATHQLRNTVSQSCIDSDNFTEVKSTKYLFTSQSQSAFQAVLSKLLNRKGCPWQLNSDRGKGDAAVHVTSIPAPKNTDTTAVRTHSDISAVNSGPSNTAHNLPCAEKDVDVIVIDDDSIDSLITVNNSPDDGSIDSLIAVNNSPVINVNKTVNGGKKDFSILPVEINCDSRQADNVDLDNIKGQLTVKSTHLVIQQSSTESNPTVTDKINPKSSEHLLAGSSIDNFSINNDKPIDRKRKLTEIVIENEKLENSALKKCITVDSQSRSDTVDSAAGLTHPHGALLAQPNRSAGCEVELSRNIVVTLDGIREACSHKENAGIISKEIMDCFLDMNVAEIKTACTYLDLAQFSEKALVNFCDSVPWSSLGMDSSSVLVNSCFSSKLRNLESPASRILLMSLVSVSRIQPQAVISLLVDMLAMSKSGEFQCQILTSVCKEFLSLDSFEYLIRQLSKEAIVVNEHLVSVLQTFVERCPNLATDSVHCFHAVLITTCHELSTNAKFGKLLMGVLTKYGDKMSGEQLTSMCALVETHSSNFRKPLLALVKRLT